MYLIFGATGNVGGEIVAQLHQQGHAVRALVRNPVKARFPEGVELAVGDLDDAESMTAAARGVDAIFFMQVAPDPAQAEKFIQAAKTAGVTRVVLLSSIGTRLEPKPIIGAGIAARDEVFRRSSLEVTYLCANALSSNALWWADSIASEGRVVDATDPGKVVPVDPYDIAKIAALALTEGGHAGKSYILNGPDALSAREQVDIVADVLGRKIEFVGVTPDELASQNVATGVPEQQAKALQNLNELFRAGRAGVVAADIENLTGTAPRSFRAWCEGHVTQLRQ